MNKSKAAFAIFALAIMAAGTTVIFQNCAKAKFTDPDTVHSAFALGICRHCSDEFGTGTTCRVNQVGAFEACHYESCRSGFQLVEDRCEPVVCEAGAIANCEIPYGEGRMICNEDNKGYGPCVPTTCEAGYTLAEGTCTADAPNPVCTPGTPIDCSTESTEGTQACNSNGSGYDECVLGDCQPGYYKLAGGECQINACGPNTITPCSHGSAQGFQTCDTHGSGWGACVINGCQPGFKLIDGVCVVKVCTPGEESVCEFAHGSGVKICNQNGTNYGPCTLLGCESGYTNAEGQCHQQQCTPKAATNCPIEGGVGVKYCFENGMGHGYCEVASCDPGFKLKNGQCVGENTCDTGETFACTGQNGTGIRACTAGHTIGPCVMTVCNEGYELVNQGNSPACKKKSNGNGNG
jgi:hypothetical protein